MAACLEFFCDVNSAVSAIYIWMPPIFQNAELQNLSTLLYMMCECVCELPNAKVDNIWQKQGVGLLAIRYELHLHNAPEKSISDYILNNQALSYLILRAYAPAKRGSTCNL